MALGPGRPLVVVCPGRQSISFPTCKITTCLFQGLSRRGLGEGGLRSIQAAQWQKCSSTVSCWCRLPSFFFAPWYVAFILRVTSWSKLVEKFQPSCQHSRLAAGRKVGARGRLKVALPG